MRNKVSVIPELFKPVCEGEVSYKYSPKIFSYVCDSHILLGFVFHKGKDNVSQLLTEIGGKYQRTFSETMKKGEDPFQTFIRGLREELGIQFDSQSFSKPSYFNVDRQYKRGKINNVLICRTLHSYMVYIPEDAYRESYSHITEEVKEVNFEWQPLSEIDWKVRRDSLLSIPSEFFRKL